MTSTNPDRPCVSRRDFLMLGGASVATVLLGDLFDGTVMADDKDKEGRFAAYPRKRICKLSELELDEPLEFLYPDDGPHSVSFIVRMSQKAGGGVGPQKNIVAFNSLCTHMGGSLRGTYKRDYRIAGPCPLHLTTFDLTRHGMVVAGHATENLPQVVLEVEGDDLYARGVLGLIYGYPSNTSFVKGK